MRTPITFTIFMLAAMTLYACGVYYGETSLDKNWGRSFEAARQAQALNPPPANPTAPVEGVDGATAANILNNYHENFKGQTSKDTTNIIKLR